MRLVDDILLSQEDQGRDNWQTQKHSVDWDRLGRPVAQFSGTRAVQGVHIVGATALNASLIVQILIPDEATSTHDAHLSVH